MHLYLRFIKTCDVIYPTRDGPETLQSYYNAKMGFAGVFVSWDFRGEKRVEKGLKGKMK